MEGCVRKGTVQAALFEKIPNLIGVELHRVAMAAVVKELALLSIVF